MFSESAGVFPAVTERDYSVPTEISLALKSRRKAVKRS